MSTNNRFRLSRGPYPQGNSLLVILRLDEKKNTITQNLGYN